MRSLNCKILLPVLAVLALTACTPAQRAHFAAYVRAHPPAASPALGQCGGDLPPCWRMRIESGGDYNARSPASFCSGRGCYGKWQFDPLTWDSAARRMGRVDLVGNYFPADPVDQDRVAAFLWDKGRGCSHWAACG